MNEPERSQFEESEIRPHQIDGPMFSVLLYARPIRAVYINASWKLPEHPEVLVPLIRVAAALGCVCFDPQRNALLREGPAQANE